MTPAIAHGILFVLWTGISVALVGVTNPVYVALNAMVAAMNLCLFIAAVFTAR